MSDLNPRPKRREPFQTQVVALGRLRLASISACPGGSTGDKSFGGITQVSNVLAL
jgi:hypothetical protein